MKTVTVLLAALAVFFLAIGMLASAQVAAPAPAMDRCMTCHPSAHPDGWTQSVHITKLKSGEVPMVQCTSCHATSYCTGCHAQYKAVQQQGGSGPTQPPAAAAP